MKIKKQFTLLITFIILIPLIYLLIVFIEDYMYSTKRYLITGYTEVELIEDTDGNYADAIEILKYIPNYVETCLLDTDTGKIIYNTIPELNDINKLSDVWKCLSSTSKKYFYQFTSPNTKKNTLLITRIIRKRPSTAIPDPVIKTLLITFSICIIICIIFILKLSNTISNSIITIKQKTKNLAEGNLTAPIIDKKNNKDLNNEILSILENLEHMRQVLYEVEIKKNNFIMGVSHDLRTPLAVIKGYSEAIMDNVIEKPEDKAAAVKLIHDKSDALEYMIEELIRFTKLNNFELKETLVPYSITKLLTDFAKEADIIQNVFERKIISDVHFTKEISVPMNKNLIIRALENLFNNAVRYTQKDGEIYITAYNTESDVILKIADRGKGISEEALPHIFDMFFRESKSRQGKGLGIGLSVVKSIFDTHEWDIDVKSKEGIGTCFTITIPINNPNIGTNNDKDI